MSFVWSDPSSKKRENLGAILNRLAPSLSCPKCGSEERFQFFLVSPLFVVNGIMDPSRNVGWRTDAPNYGEVHIKKVRCQHCDMEGELHAFKGDDNNVSENQTGK